MTVTADLCPYILELLTAGGECILGRQWQRRRDLCLRVASLARSQEVSSFSGLLKFDSGHPLRLLLSGQSIPLRGTGEGFPCLVLSI